MSSVIAKKWNPNPVGLRMWNSAFVITAGLVFAECCPTTTTAKEPPQKNVKQSSDKTLAKAHPLAAAIRIAKSSQETLETVKDFDATFCKQELVNNRLYPHMMFIKYRNKPLSVYLRFNKPHEGREVIYFEGRNDGKLLAHETGIKGVVGTVSLTPTSKKALSEGRHPITKIGLHNMLQEVIQQWERETKYGEVNIKYFPNAKLKNSNPMLRELECKVIESSHPRPRKQFPYHLTRLYIDKKMNLPVRVEQYGFPPRPGAAPPLIAEYTYWNIRTNVGLKNADFDTKNSQYDF
jgi:hypothetical protein